MNKVFGFLAIILTSVIFVNGVAFAQYDLIPHQTVVILNPISSSVPHGHTITFSGKLMTSNKIPIPNETIYIQYDSPYQSTRTLATATTDHHGNFEVTWKAIPKHKQSVGTYFIFANFFGDDQYGYSYSKTFPLTVLYLQVKTPTNCYQMC